MSRRILLIALLCTIAARVCTNRQAVAQSMQLPRRTASESGEPILPRSIYSQHDGPTAAPAPQAGLPVVPVPEDIPYYGSPPPPMASTPSLEDVPVPPDGEALATDELVELPSQEDGFNVGIGSNEPGSFLFNANLDYRFRQHNENGLRGSDLSGRHDNFLLMQLRPSLSFEYVDYFRIYLEAIDANSAWEDYAPRPTEENSFDGLNVFIDSSVFNTGDQQLWLRGGRQEMRYGAERLISPLEWANTRRTFDGGKLFYEGVSWNIDGFYTLPVPFAQHVDNDSNYDRSDSSQRFVGIYATYRGLQGAEIDTRTDEVQSLNSHTLDFYFLRLDEDHGPGTLFFPRELDANTLGSRWAGKVGGWHTDVEGGLQFGKFGNKDLFAQFFTAGLGYEWVSVYGKPRFWSYYDWASGDSNPADDKHSTFNQLFPDSHSYFGYADLVGRQNIQDVNFKLAADPLPDWTLELWYHIFRLDKSRDALYNAAGTPIRFDPTGRAGRDVGQELDVTLKLKTSPNGGWLFGYSRFWAGDFVRTTSGGEDRSLDFYYTQFATSY